MADRSWHEHAACRGCDPGLFTCERDDAVEEARRWCRMCTVRLECLREGVALGDVDTIRAGLSPRQRRRLVLAGVDLDALELIDPYAEDLAGVDAGEMVEP